MGHVVLATRLLGLKNEAAFPWLGEQGFVLLHNPAWLSRSSAGALQLFLNASLCKEKHRFKIKTVILLRVMGQEESS